MADPRTYTVKQCEPAYLQKSGAGIAGSTADRRDFFNSIGKIGDLQVLNSIGGGNIGKGLRNLNSISNSIRVGTGALPTSIGTSIDTGANWVLQQTGIAPTVVNMLRPLNPAIANQAYGQAKQVYSKVKAGNFKTTDIPSALQDFQNLERLGRNIFTPGAGDAQTALGEHCEASPYAVDLIARAPKFKFLFVVQFIPDAGYGPLGDQDFGPLDMAFTVKRSSRPNIKFHHEDVNYYNFRTKVVTKTEFDEMNMSFHDDTMNVGTRFYHSYMRAMSPITGIEASGAQSDMLEQGGMDFVDNTLSANQIINQIAASKYAASSGTLVNDRKQVFSEIRIYHLFDNGNRMNVWRFFNPRISALNLDELDMSVGNEGSELSLTFNYDSVFLDPDVSLASANKYNLKQTQRGGVYPLRYNGNATKGNSPIDAVTNIGSSGSAADLLGPLKNASNQVASLGKSAVASVADLGTKFSKAITSLPFGGSG
jgi:hypothetical protein